MLAVRLPPSAGVWKAYELGPGRVEVAVAVAGRKLEPSGEYWAGERREAEGESVAKERFRSGRCWLVDGS